MNTDDLRPCFSCYPVAAPLAAAGVEDALATLGGPVDTSALASIDRPDPLGHLSALKEKGIPFIADIHSHFFPDVVMHRIWRWFDGVGWPIAYRLPLGERLQALHDNGVRHFTSLLYAHKPGMAAGLNAWVFKNLSGLDGMILSGTFYPEEGVDNYTATALDGGMRAFKLHCEVSDLDLNDARLTAVFNRLHRLKVPLIIHCGTAPVKGDYTGISFFKRFIDHYPEMTVIVAHMGAWEIDDFLGLVNSGRYPNLYLDTTMVFTDFEITGAGSMQFIPALQKCSERIFFGSDFPNIPYFYEHPINKLLQSGLDDTALHNILYANMCRLFDLALPAV